MPVCFAVDSFNEMWCWGVNVPKLRAIIATVRNFARAAFTTFGVVVFCLLMSLSSPFRLFKLCSVQAMDTCIAPPVLLQSPSRAPRRPAAGRRLPSRAGLTPRGRRGNPPTLNSEKSPRTAGGLRERCLPAMPPGGEKPRT